MVVSKHTSYDFNTFKYIQTVFMTQHMLCRVNALRSLKEKNVHSAIVEHSFYNINFIKLSDSVV